MLWRRQPPPRAPRASLPPRRKKRRKKRRKMRRKKRGGDITPIRLRRSLFFVAPATPAGTASGARPADPAAVCPAPPSCLRLARPRRVRAVEPSCPGCAGAADGRASAKAHRGRVLVANQVSAWPLCSPWVRKGRTTRNRRPDRHARRPVNACLLTSAQNCPELPGIARLGGGPEQVSAHRPPFSVGLTTSAVSGSSRRPPGSFRCG